ncbi:hypothetical protein IX51_03575 [uncultured archaeon]|nr:hypothetical protein IX51_03575 [uncultured archaeon]
MKNIDIHSHMLHSSSIEQLGGEINQIENSPLYAINVLGKKVAPMPKGFFDTDARISEIAEMGIEGQIISPTHHLFMYDKDASSAAKSARIQNEGISRVCSEHSGRFAGNATLPMQDAKHALDELEYAYSKLEMKGIEIGTNINGRNLDDESLFPVYERAQELGMPIFVHPNDFMAKERLSKYYMGIVVGTLAETTVAVSSLLLGNVFGKFQKLKMVFCHGGGAIPYQIGRLQHAVDIREELKDANVDISKGIRNILFDSVVFTPEALDFLIKETGEDNVVLGTDYPFNMGNWNSAKDLQNLSTISETTRNKVMLENTKKLYGL